jgi:hypothetical protein
MECRLKPDEVKLVSEAETFCIVHFPLSLIRQVRKTIITCLIRDSGKWTMDSAPCPDPPAG